MASPVAPFLCQQLLELAERDYPSFDRRPVGDRLSTEVIRHRNVLTGQLLHRFMPGKETSSTLGAATQTKA